MKARALLAAACVSCGTDERLGDPAGAHAAPTWMIELDPSSRGRRLSPGLLGHYDLSGELFRYDRVPGLGETLAGAGFREWRLGVGRWEAGTHYLPALTDGSPCPPSPVPQAYAPAGWTDEDVLGSRDWFVDDGRPVTLTDTLDDERYSLGYIRRSLDVVSALGATPFMSIDLMPRALAAATAPLRDARNTPAACVWTYANQISNGRPRDEMVFAAAVAGMVERVVAGDRGERGRPVTHWEIWNEPDLCVFWDPGADDGVPCVDEPFDQRLHAFLTMAVPALVALDDLRRTSPHPDVRAIRIGLGSFAFADVAALVLDSFDRFRLPDGRPVPLDFLSFHSYNHDPLGIVHFTEIAAAARERSATYPDIDLMLTEFGPFPDVPFDDASLEQPVRIATALVLGIGAGLDRAHHTIFYDYWGDSAVQWGLVSHDVRPKPLFHAYALLHRLIGEGATPWVPVDHPSGRLDDGGAVVVAEGEDGVTRALVVNRSSDPRTVGFSIDGRRIRPTALTVYDDPTGAPHDALPGEVVLLPGPSLGLFELARRDLD